jgi:NADPH-dependent FMN reductase
VAELRRLMRRQTELIDLSSVDLAPFDYVQPLRQDAFDGVVEMMLASPAILFATPVYWYAMSGRMKTLFDRFSDLLGDRDPNGRGRRLAGRDVWMLAAGTDAEAPPGFDDPFARSAAYLDMRWRGGCYLPLGNRRELAQRLAAFATRIDDRLSAS